MSRSASGPVYGSRAVPSVLGTTRPGRMSPNSLHGCRPLRLAVAVEELTMRRDTLTGGLAELPVRW
ncbi:hypothetical protein GCM10010094_57810 [Streptomyces flaveus]|uniref:Uncharacterized protein n=1 Tax=Streptomyces flaveus TaxID=66370 RepID=A0A917R4X9_9ACTN|nr:hypothetical protein GCM10010094_57810 [Streptomyces flaveus]